MSQHTTVTMETTTLNNRANGSFDEGFLINELIKLHCQISLDNIGHCVVFFVFAALGVFGNVILLFGILLNKPLLSVPNIFIVNLTIADLVYILSTAPFNIRHELTACWILGTTACKIKHYIPLVTQGACILSLTALSRERYTAVVKGLESRFKKSYRRTCVIVGLCWLAGFVIGIPVLFISQTNTYGLLCQYMPIEDGFTWAKTYIIFIFLIFYVVPFMIISGHHVEIVRTLCKKSLAKITETNQAALRQMKARKKLALIVIIITLFFGIFWFPYHVYHIWYMFTKNHGNIRGNKNHVQIFRHLYNYMSLANSCLNPWVVFVMSSAHRMPIIIFCRKLSCTKRLPLERLHQRVSTKTLPTTECNAGSTSLSKV